MNEFEQLTVLITGASGCAGHHLATLALRSGAQVFGTSRARSVPEGVIPLRGDLRNREDVRAWIATARPNRIYHLAAAVHGSGSHGPEDYYKINLEGTYHLLAATVELAPHARVLTAGSAAIYGQSGPTPITVETPLRPRSAYAVSKAAGDLLSGQFFLEHELHVVRARTFNQTGPREAAGLVCATLARQIALVEAGLQEPRLKVLTLKTARDYCDVRDVASAYWAALEQGEPGEIYNVCAGRATSIGEIVEILMGLSRVKGIALDVAEEGNGKGIRSQVGDSSKLRACSGWRPEIPIARSLTDLLEEWRRKVASGEVSA